MNFPALVERFLWAYKEINFIRNILVLTYKCKWCKIAYIKLKTQQYPLRIPELGLEPRSPACEAGVITTILHQAQKMKFRINIYVRACLTDRFEQCASTSVFKYFHNNSPSYMAEIYNPASRINIGTRNSFLKLKQPSRKTKQGQNCLSYIGPSTWNRLPTKIKDSNNVNKFQT